MKRRNWENEPTLVSFTTHFFDFVKLWSYALKCMFLWSISSCTIPRQLLISVRTFNFGTFSYPLQLSPCQKRSSIWDFIATRWNANNFILFIFRQASKTLRYSLPSFLLFNLVNYICSTARDSSPIFCLRSFSPPHPVAVAAIRVFLIAFLIYSAKAIMRDDLLLLVLPCSTWTRAWCHQRWILQKVLRIAIDVFKNNFLM